MPILFPTSPALNELFLSGTKTYQWDGEKWNLYSTGLVYTGPTGPTGPAAPNLYSASETAPSGPAQGQAWFNTANGLQYAYVGTAWVEIGVSEVGPTGPTGPTGAGIQGPTGPTGPAPSIAATGSSTTTENGLGFIGIPQRAPTGTTYTTTYADQGAHIYLNGPTGPTVNIAANASVTYPIGTVITFITGAGVTATIQSSDNLRQALAGATGPRTLAPYGIATAAKVASTTWYISGNGLS